MTFWFVGEEEHSEFRFTTSTLGLYVRAGIRFDPSPSIWHSWCRKEAP
jgi:hypothetical protein